MESTVSCASWVEDLSAFLDEELAPERSAGLRAHLDACADCRARIARLREVDALLVAGAERVSVPADLRARLAARIAADEAAPPRAAEPRAPARRVPRLARRAAGLAAAAAAALALYLARPTSEPAPPPLSELPRLAERAPTPPEVAPILAPEAAAPTLAESVLGGSDEDLALLLELETVEDLDVIANLDLLERLVELEGETG